MFISRKYFHHIFSNIIDKISQLSQYGQTRESDIKREILNGLLQVHDTSEHQILKRLAEAKGNDEEIINGINSELKENILEKEGDLVKLKSEGLRNLLGKSTERVACKLSGSPVLGSILRETVDEGLRYQNDDLESWVEENAIPVDALVRFVDIEVDGNARRKRSKNETSEVAQVSPFGLNVIIDTIRGLLSFITSPLNNILKGILSSILTNIYPIIGYFILTPLRALLNTIIDLLLPCNNCTVI